MRVSFETRPDGTVEPVVTAASEARERLYCKHHWEFSEAMVDPDDMRVIGILWDVPTSIPCGCGEDGCEDCGSGEEFPVARVYYEAWEHPSLFAEVSKALGEPIGACDAVLLVPRWDVIDGLSREDFACITARDIAEIAMVRGGYYGGGRDDDVKRTQMVHAAAAALLLQACVRAPFGFGKAEMEGIRDRLFEWSLRYLTEPHGWRQNGEAIFLSRNPGLFNVLCNCWRLAVEEAPPTPLASSALLPAAESIAARALESQAASARKAA